MNSTVFKFLMLSALSLTYHASASFAQDLPTDGLLPGPNTFLGNDTIIGRGGPIIGIGHLSPALIDITAIYHHGLIAVTSTSESVVSYQISGYLSNAEIQGRVSVSKASPAIINITDLPSGHYTLRLYINNECLEGEFEKE